MQPYQSYVNTMIQAPTPQYPDRYFVLERLLGDGGEGAVYLAKQSKGYLEKVALKLQSSTKDDERIFLENIIQYQNKYENTQSYFYNPSFIIRIYEIFPWKNKVAIVMEVGKKNLFKYLKQNPRLDLNEKGIICKSISKSIEMLHYFGFAHRDIKPENYIQVGNEWKLCDFELTKKHQHLKTKNIGSIQYTAPEILNDSGTYSNKVDIWSLGCVFYEIIEGKELFPGINMFQLGNNREAVKELIFKSKDDIQEKLNQLKISENWRKTLINMLQQDPSQRISAKELFQEISASSILPASEQQQFQRVVQNDIPIGFRPNQNWSQPVYQTPAAFKTSNSYQLSQPQSQNQQAHIVFQTEKQQPRIYAAQESMINQAKQLVQQENLIKKNAAQEIQTEVKGQIAGNVTLQKFPCQVLQPKSNQMNIEQKASESKGQNDVSSGQQINKAISNHAQQGTVTQNQNNIPQGQIGEQAQQLAFTESKQLQHQQYQSIQTNQQSDPMVFNQKQKGQANFLQKNIQDQENQNNQFYQQSEATSQLPVIQQNFINQQLGIHSAQQTFGQIPSTIAQTEENLQQIVQTTCSPSLQQNVEQKNQEQTMNQVQIKLFHVQCDILDMFQNIMSQLSKVKNLEKDQKQIINDLGDTIEALNEKFNVHLKKY